MSMKTDILRTTVVTALMVSASSLASNAHAVYENEPNNSIATAQRLVLIGGISVELTGSIGVTAIASSAVGDVDFYTFEGREGDIISIDIDGGMKAKGSSTRSVDTIVAIFGPGPAYKVLRQNDDGGTPLDAGSISPWDARIDKVRLPATGTYTIGVSSYPRSFRDGGALTSATLNSNSNGSYTLLVTPVFLSVLQVNIEIKPGSGTIAPVNPKSRGNVPVALLSSMEFDALSIKHDSITFGATGNEASLLRCGKDGEDVDGDGRPDLVCHFENQETGFEPGDMEGILRGQTALGRPFEGRGYLKVLPAKRNQE